MKKRELFTFIEALLFIIGAVFLSVNIVNGKGVYFFAGIALALIAFAICIVSFIAGKRNKTADAEKAPAKQTKTKDK
jgi:hypothetical protein